MHRLAKITKVSITDALRQYVKPLIIFIIMTINKNIFMKDLNPVLSMIIFTGLYVALIVIHMKGKLKTENKAVF